MRTRFLPLAAAVIGSTMIAAPLTAAATTSPPSSVPSTISGYQEYVALGDSYSADVVFLDKNGGPDATYAPLDCFQSRANYPKQVAKALNVPRFRDATCGSATTEHFTHAQTGYEGGLALGGTNPPQFDRLTNSTDLVTVGIGGNDAGIGTAVLNCLSALPLALPLPTLPAAQIPYLPVTSLPLGGCKERFTAGGIDQLAAAIDKTKPKLVNAFRQIHERSPHARILAVNYLAAIPARGCWPLVPITNSDMAYLNTTFLRLNAMISSAATEGGAELVDTYTATLGHDICTGPTTRYVEGIGIVSLNGPALMVPAHPNSAGADAQANAVLEQIDE